MDISRYRRPGAFSGCTCLLVFFVNSRVEYCMLNTASWHQFKRLGEFRTLVKVPIIVYFPAAGLSLYFLYILHIICVFAEIRPMLNFPGALSKALAENMHRPQFPLPQRRTARAHTGCLLILGDRLPTFPPGSKVLDYRNM